jgi:ribonuclease Y
LYETEEFFVQEMFVGQGMILSLGFFLLGFFFHAYLTKTNALAAKKQSRAILSDAEKEADIIRREANIQAKDAVQRTREKAEKDLIHQRRDILDLERRIVEREKNLSGKLHMLGKKEEALDKDRAELKNLKQLLSKKEAQLQTLIDEEAEKIEQAAQLSREEARKTIMGRMEKELRAEAGGLVRHIQKQAKEEAQKKAREIISTAIQRYAAETVCDITTSTVSLSSDDVKGRIIGREGRNIKSFEQVTGVNLLIDETPEIVVLSCFDPIRREVARVALERLIEDGRIHPARIEETVEQVRKEIDDSIRKAGEEALYKLGITGVAPELMHTLGKLKFRTSFKQNVLEHSMETAYLLSKMAAEMGLDEQIARRVGIFHDLGKALDQKAEGSHAIAGAHLLRKHGEDPLVYNAVGAHHGEMERESVYAVLCEAADAITAARPGARMENTDLYLQRLEKIEKICNQHEGVKSSYAVQAGREVRIMVEPGKLNDQASHLLAKNIAQQIGKEVKVPGVVRVTVIRETRCVEYAK